MIQERTVVGKEKLSRQSARWDLQNIFYNYFTLVGSQIGSALFSFATVWLATKIYGTDGYGNIVAIIAGSQAIQLFTNWTNIALDRNGVQEFVETGNISKTFWARTAIAAPNIAIVATTAPLWIYWIFALLHLSGSVLWYVVLHFLMSAIWLLFQHSLQAAKLPRVQGTLLFVERAIIFGLIFLLGYILHLPWLYAFTAFIAASLLMSVVAYFRLRGVLKGIVAVDRTAVKKVLAFSLPLVPYSVTSFFCTNYLDAFFITSYLQKSDLTLYSVAYQVNGLLLQFLILVGTLLMPMFVTLRSRSHQTHINQYIEHLLPSFTLIWAAVIPFVALMISYLIPLVFGAEFSKLNDVLWVFMTGTSFVLPSLIGYSPFATAASAVYISFPLAAATAVTNVVGNFLLIPKWGLLGSAWSTTLSSFVALVTIVFLNKMRFQFATSMLYKSLLPAIVCLMTFLMIGDSVLASIIGLITAVVLALTLKRQLKSAFKYSYNILQQRNS